jgi:hypothetical protein
MEHANVPKDDFENEAELRKLFDVAIKECETFKDLVVLELGSLTIDSKRKRLAILFLAIALDHFRAIIHLLDDGRYVTSAFALVRPLMDAAFRSIWIAHIATDDEILEAESNTEAKYPNPRKVCQLMQIKFGDETDELVHTISKDWKRLSGYVHTGLPQLTTKLSAGSSATFPGGRALTMLLRSSAHLCYGVSFFATSIPNVEMAQRIDKAHDLLFEKIGPSLGAHVGIPPYIN